MKEMHPDDLGPPLSAAVERWRDAPAPAGELTPALERLVRRSPRSRWRAWPLLPGAAAAATLAVMLGSAPAAWAEVASTLRQQAGAPPTPDEAALRAAVRPLLIAHIAALLAGYLLFFAVWSVTQAEVILGLFGARRWRARVARGGPWGVAGGLGLWLIGTVLGAIWARYVLGRFWGWDPIEVQSLFVIGVSLGWLVLVWYFRASPTLAAAWAGLLFWVLLDLLSGGLHWLLVPARSYGLQPAVVCFFVSGALLNVVLLASAWYAGRERKIGEGPAG